MYTVCVYIYIYIYIYIYNIYIYIYVLAKVAPSKRLGPASCRGY